MKISLIAALSLDGFIAQSKTQSSFGWTSKADKKRFIDTTMKAGVVVMGSATFDTIGKPLKNRRTIVYTSRPEAYPGIETTNKSPEALIEKLTQDGFKELIICGGSHIYTLFAEKQLIDTLYITIEPVVFGNGIQLFNKDFYAQYTLISVDKVENTLLLEYSKA